MRVCVVGASGKLGQYMGEGDGDPVHVTVDEREHEISRELAGQIGVG